MLRSQLLGALSQLGVEPVVHATQPPQPEPGKGYPADEFARFPSLIDQTWIEQPGLRVDSWSQR